MVDIPMRSSAPVTRQTVLSINERKVEGAKTTRTITSINHTSSQAVSNASTPASKPLPPLVHMVQKGQKNRSGAGIGVGNRLKKAEVGQKHQRTTREDFQ